MQTTRIPESVNQKIKREKARLRESGFLSISRKRDPQAHKQIRIGARLSIFERESSDLPMAWTKARLEHIATNAAVTLYLREEAFWTQIRTQTLFRLA